MKKITLFIIIVLLMMLGTSCATASLKRKLASKEFALTELGVEGVRGDISISCVKIHNPNLRNMYQSMAYSNAISRFTLKNFPNKTISVMGEVLKYGKSKNWICVKVKITVQ